MLFKLSRRAFSRIAELQKIHSMKYVNFDDMHNIERKSTKAVEMFKERLKNIYDLEKEPPINLNENFLYGFESDDFKERPEVLKKAFSLTQGSDSQVLSFKIQKAIQKFQKHPLDTGSLGCKVAAMSEKIIYLVGLANRSRKDKMMLRQLDQLYSDRNKLLNKLRLREPNMYIWLVKEYDINHSQKVLKGFKEVKLPRKNGSGKGTKYYIPQDKRRNLNNNPYAITH